MTADHVFDTRKRTHSGNAGESARGSDGDMSRNAARSEQQTEATAAGSGSSSGSGGGSGGNNNKKKNRMPCSLFDKKFPYGPYSQRLRKVARYAEDNGRTPMKWGNVPLNDEENSACRVMLEWRRLNAQSYDTDNRAIR